MDKKTLGKEGCYNGDDSWLHNLQEDDAVVSKVNREYRTLRKSELYLDLAKGVRGKLNTSKLVKRRVMVRRADGSTFFREQWVRPDQLDSNDRTTSGEQEVQEDRVLPLQEPEMPSLQADVEMYPPLEASKKKSYDVSTQKGFLDEKLDNMSKEEKQKLIDRYRIEWNRHDNPQRDWMLAVMALKEHMYKNPQLLGAEHLSKEGNGDPIVSGIDRETQYCNDIGREKCYDLMKEYRLGDGIDPKVADPNDKGAPIKHMRNMMTLKTYLKENPHLIDKKEIGKTSKVPSPAEKGGNDIHEILKKMSNDEKYKLAKELGICKGDPKKDEDCYDDLDKRGNKLHPDIKHMRNMMELKKRIELEPSILIKDSEGIPRDIENKRIDSMTDKQKQDHELKELCGKLSKEGKQHLLNKYKDKEVIANRKTNASSAIDWMLSMTALKELMSTDSEVLKDAQDMLGKESIATQKFGNKDLEKILRGMLGITSKYIDYVKVVDPQKEWEYGVGSSIMKQQNDNGDWVLSVLDTGYDGSEWNEHEIKVEDAMKFLSDWNERKASGKDTGMTPLHEKEIPEIIKTLSSNFNAYSKKAGDRLRPLFNQAWRRDKTDNVKELIVGIDDMTVELACNLLEKWDVPVETYGSLSAVIDTQSDSWKDIAYSDLIHKDKRMNAYRYVTEDMYGDSDNYPLLKSAMNWSPEERAEARRELVDGSMNIVFPKSFSEKKQSEVRETLSRYTTECLDIAPFDILAEMFTSSSTGKNLRISITNEARSNFDASTNTINMSSRYVNRFYEYEHDNPFNFNGGVHPYVDTLCHEWAHALDSFFSGRGKYLNWNTDMAEKYVPQKHRNCIRDSFNGNLQSSNPDKQMIRVKVGDSYEYYYKDEWMSNYEGRAYSVDESKLRKDSKGHFFDDTPIGEYQGQLAGVEHFSENISRYGCAMMAYKQWYNTVKEQSTEPPMSFDHWCQDMANWYENNEFGDDATQEKYGISRESYRNGLGKNTYLNRKNNPSETYGYLLHTLKKRNPSIWSFINNVLNRPDFHKTTNVEDKPTERASNGEFTRKSLYINL